MDPSNQEVYFVELNDLDQQSYSEVVSILHGQKQTKKVEFPWETKKSHEKNEFVPKADHIVPVNEVILAPPVEAPHMMVSYPMVPAVVPIVAAPFHMQPGELVNGVPHAATYPPHSVMPDMAGVMHSDVVLDMSQPPPAHPLEVGMTYSSPIHQNGPLVVANCSPVHDVSHLGGADVQFLGKSSIMPQENQHGVYVSNNSPSDVEPCGINNNSNSAQQDNKKSLGEAIKSSHIFSQVLGGKSSEASTGISFFTDDTLPSDGGLSFFQENVESTEEPEPEPKLSPRPEEADDKQAKATEPAANHQPEQKADTPTPENRPIVKEEEREVEKDLGKVNPASNPTPPSAAPQSKSWAGLFKSSSSKSAVVSVSQMAEEPSPVVASTADSKVEEEVNLPVAASEDSASSELAALLSQVKLNHASVALQPRGLINNSNWCYINSTLQALTACPPFYHLMKKLRDFPPMSRGSSSTPILDSMLEFIGEFNVMPRQHEAISNGHKYDKRHKNFDLEPGFDFEPKYIHNMLHVIEVNPAFKLGRQEDAEEFLSILLDGLHEEMAAAINSISSKDLKPSNQTNGVSAEADEEEDDDDDDSWEQVGPKNKSVVTRRATFSKTPISDIFAGQMRSVVSKTGSKESATLQPFFTLQLDIQGKVFSVRDALEGLVSKEIVEDYFDKKTNQKIEIMRRTTLEELPPVLILHLKCFVYNAEGSQKLLKNIDFDVELKITKDLVSSTAKIPSSHKSYKLFAVVYHHGVKSTGGHYTSCVFHPGINGWIHIDDRRIETVNVQKVLKYMPPRMPYLLYYRRTDLTYS